MFKDEACDFQLSNKHLKQIGRTSKTSKRGQRQILPFHTYLLYQFATIKSLFLYFYIFLM